MQKLTVHDFSKATLLVCYLFFKQLPYLQVLKAFHLTFFILLSLVNSCLALLAMGLHCSFFLCLLQKIPCALCLRPQHWSFLFSCILFSHIRLAAELAINSSHMNNIMVTSARNASDRECFADCLWEVRIPLPEYPVLLPITLDIELFTMSSPLHRAGKRFHPPNAYVIHGVGGWYYSDMGHISDSERGTRITW